VRREGGGVRGAAVTDDRNALCGTRIASFEVALIVFRWCISLGETRFERQCAFVTFPLGESGRKARRGPSPAEGTAAKRWSAADPPSGRVIKAKSATSKIANDGVGFGQTDTGGSHPGPT
jgi:hypothetical protein